MPQVSSLHMPFRMTGVKATKPSTKTYPDSWPSTAPNKKSLDYRNELSRQKALLDICIAPFGQFTSNKASTFQTLMALATHSPSQLELWCIVIRTIITHAIRIYTNYISQIPQFHHPPDPPVAPGPYGRFSHAGRDPATNHCHCTITVQGWAPGLQGSRAI